MNTKFLTEYIGIKFNRLTILEAYRKREKNRTKIYYKCQCDCGNIKDIRRSAVIKNQIKSCGCLRNENYINKPVKFKRPYGEANKHAVFVDYKGLARKRNRTFLLSKTEACKLFEQNCFYCGKPPCKIKNAKYSNGPFHFNGIDRIDNNIGYEIDNCVTCCQECNFTKIDKNFEEFVNWLFKVTVHLKNNFHQFPIKYKQILEKIINNQKS